MSPSGPTGDRARVAVRVEVAPEVAFEVFTSEIDLWWRRGIRFRPSGRAPGMLHLEPGVGGRLFESYAAPGGERLAEVGRVTVWSPPSRLVFEWRNQNFTPHERTRVEVRFEAERGGTLVTVEHSGWAALRPDHPARHGRAGAGFAGTLGMWWAELLRGFREHALGRGA